MIGRWLKEVGGPICSRIRTGKDATGEGGVSRVSLKESREIRKFLRETDQNEKEPAKLNLQFD